MAAEYALKTNETPANSGIGMRNVDSAFQKEKRNGFRAPVMDEMQRAQQCPPRNHQTICEAKYKTMGGHRAESVARCLMELDKSIKNTR